MNVTALKKAGFVEDGDLKAAHEKAADKNNLSASGKYDVLGVLKRGLVTLMFEQNTASEPSSDGLTVSVSHPAVCVVSGPAGRVAVNAADTDLILSVAADLE